MAEQGKLAKSVTTNPLPEEGQPGPGILHKEGQLKGDLDNLMKEIDEVLEENAEEFVKGYVQRGGE